MMDPMRGYMSNLYIPLTNFFEFISIFIAGPFSKSSVVNFYILICVEYFKVWQIKTETIYGAAETVV